MPKEVRIVAANDPIGALLAIAEAFAGGPAVFLSPPKALDETPTGVTARATSSATALIIESSGSTGYPKRIELSQSALVASAEATISRLGGAGQWLLALPVNYIAGAQVLVRSLLSETQPVVMNTAVPFTAEGFARAASQMTGSRRYAALVPTQLHRLATAIQDEFLLEQLKRFDAILVGGQAVNQIDFAILVDAGVNLIETYGMTETAGGCVYDGVPLPGVTIRLSPLEISTAPNTAGQPATEGISESGRIEISGAMLAEGIGEWLQTEDVGELDAAGKLRVLGRIDRVVNSGGIKVALDRVELVAQQVGGVTQVAAVALPSLEWGQQVAVVYSGSPEVADSIAQQLADELGPAGRPVRVIRVSAIPQLPNQKVDYRAVSQLLS